MNQLTTKIWCGLAVIIFIGAETLHAEPLSIRVCSNGICPDSIPLTTYPTVGSPQNNESASSNTGGGGAPYGGYSNASEVGVLNVPTGGTIFDSQEAQLSKVKSPVQGYPSPEKLEYNVSFGNMAVDAKSAAFGYIDANGNFNYNPIKADATAVTQTSDGQTRSGYGSGTPAAATFASVDEAVDKTNFVLSDTVVDQRQTAFNYSKVANYESSSAKQYEVAAALGNDKYAEDTKAPVMTVEQLRSFKKDFLEWYNRLVMFGETSLDINGRMASLEETLIAEDREAFNAEAAAAMAARKGIDQIGPYNSSNDQQTYLVNQEQLALIRAGQILDRAAARMDDAKLAKQIEALNHVQGTANTTQLKQFVANFPNYSSGKSKVAASVDVKDFAKYLTNKELDQFLALSKKAWEAGDDIYFNPKATPKEKAEFQRLTTAAVNILKGGIERAEKEIVAEGAKLATQLKNTAVTEAREKANNPKVDIPSWAKKSAEAFGDSFVRAQRDVAKTGQSIESVRNYFAKALSTNNKDAADQIIKAVRTLSKDIEIERWNLIYLQDKGTDAAITTLLKNQRSEFAKEIGNIREKYRL